MVCDKGVCERWCDKDGVTKMVCDKEVCEDAEAEAKTEEAAGTDLKTRTPHNFVGKRKSLYDASVAAGRWKKTTCCWSFAGYHVTQFADIEDLHFRKKCPFHGFPTKHENVVSHCGTMWHLLLGQ